MHPLSSRLCFVALACINLQANSKPNLIAEPCETTTPAPLKMGLRYTSPKGIGYSTGYTTLEGFFSPVAGNDWVPLLDLRGHVFDNGKFAANAGIGIRYVHSNCIFGFNSYYDFRGNKHRNYNQASIGFEALGNIWDLRLNGYLPFGKKTSPLRHAQFNRFQGHSMLLRSKRDFALKGINLQVGAHLDRYRSAPLYFAAGPYVLNGKGGTVWGGEALCRVDLFDQYFRLEANVSYDSYFRWSGQGQIGLNIPLGKGKRVYKKGPCPSAAKLYARSNERVERHEIIPVGKQHVYSQAINPVTQEPYYFVFVDNTSSSQGTYESPFPRLVDAENNSAENQIIYVFPGDGTSTNMSSGITLKNGQMLLGASIPYTISTTIGSVVIPPFASTLPIITNAATNTVVTLNNNNTVAGLYIDNKGTGISGTGITNFTANQNTIIGVSPVTGTGTGILLSDVFGEMQINGNEFLQNDGYALDLSQSSAQCSVFLNQNTISCIATDAINLQLTLSGSIESFKVSNTFFSSTTANDTAIIASLAGTSSIQDFVLTNCEGFRFNYFVNAAFSDTSAISNFIFSDSILTSTNAPIFFNLADSNNMDTFICSNVSMSHYNQNGGFRGYDIRLANTSSIRDITFRQCYLQNFRSNGINFEIQNTSHVDHLIIDKSTCTGSTTALNVVLQNSGSIIDTDLTGNNFNGNSNGINFFSMDSSEINRIFVKNSTFLGTSAIPIAIDFRLTSSISDLQFEDLDLTVCSSPGFNISLSQATTGSIGNISFRDISFSCSDDNFLSLLLANNSQIDNISMQNVFAYGINKAIDCQLSNSSDINNITINNSMFSAFTQNNQSSAVKFTCNSANTIQNVSISNTTITGFYDGALYLELRNTSSIDTVYLNNCTISSSESHSIFIPMNNTAHISNLLIYNTSFDSTNGAHFDCTLSSNSYIENFQINNCSFASGENGVKISGFNTSYVNDIKITNSDFKSTRFNAAIINPKYFESCEISNNSFESMGDIAVTVSPTNVPPVTGELIISGNDFYSNKTRSIDVNFSAGTYETNITNNTFTGVAVQALGYSAQIQTSGGTTCLDFVGNQSTPINFGGSADPYYFLNTSGTFNLTPESTQQNNIGTIQQSGSFGSCP